MANDHDNKPEDDVILRTLDDPEPEDPEGPGDPGGGDIMAYCCLDGINIGFILVSECVGMGGTQSLTGDDCEEEPEDPEDPPPGGCPTVAYWSLYSDFSVYTTMTWDNSSQYTGGGWLSYIYDETDGHQMVASVLISGSGHIHKLMGDYRCSGGGQKMVEGLYTLTKTYGPHNENLYVAIGQLPDPPAGDTFDETMSGGVVGGSSALVSRRSSLIATGGLLSSGSSVISLQTPLLAHYPLYDCRASTNVVDVSGNAKDATIIGGDNSNTLSVIGPCPAIPMGMDLDGTADYVAATTYPIAAPGTGSYTVLVRFKSDNTSFGAGAGSTIASFGQGGSTTNGLRILIVTGNLYCECHDGTLSGRRIAFTDTASWHSVALVIDRSTQKLIGYLDGSTSGWTANTVSGGTNDTLNGSGNITASADIFRIGNRLNGATHFRYDGQLADVRVYNKALSAGEILAFHNEQVLTGAKCSGSATSSVARSVVPTGGIRGGSSAVPRITYSETPTGGLRGGSSGSVGVVTSRSTSGGVRLGGQAPNWRHVDLLCGGSAVVTTRSNHIGSGGLTASGLAVPIVSINVSGGARISGQAIEEYLINWHYSVTLTIPAGRVTEDRYKQLVRVRIPTTSLMSNYIVLDANGDEVATEIRRKENNFAVLAIKANLKKESDNVYEVKYR